jgi:hypothetical protein
METKDEKNHLRELRYKFKRHMDDTLNQSPSTAFYLRTESVSSFQNVVKK